MDLSSSDLELVADQVIGMRFNNIDIPHGVNIIDAYIQFTVDETKGSDSGAILYFHAQAVDSALTFTSSAYDISSRVKTNATIQWDVPPWNSVGEAGGEQVTPNLSSVIQEIVDRSGWIQFNSIVIIVTGAGTRTAEAFDGESEKAPLLVIEYESGPPECSDGADNDFDGLIDFPNDPGCSSATDGDELGQNECDDGIDNDDDGFIDILDEGCLDLTGIDETDCGDTVCEGGEIWLTCTLDCPVPQCADGQDNDGDSLTDFPDDPECSDSSDNSEFAASRPWKFAALGDTRSGHDAHSENVIGIVNMMPNGERITVLNSGDITVSGELSQWQTWQSIVNPLAINRNKIAPPEYIGAVGNHDTEAPDWLINWNNFLPAQRGLTAYLGIPGDIDGRFGSVIYDNAIFIWVDSTTPTSAQDTFLENTLTSASLDPELDWKFVFFHHPPITCGGHDDWSQGKSWNDNLFVPYGVDILFLGHTHYYERTCPFTSATLKICDETNRGSIINDSNGVVHIITGGGGASISETGDCAWLESKAELHHFLEVEIDSGILNVKVWDTDNGGGANPTLIDDFTIIKYETPQCSDAIDNDNDGLVDFPADTGCSSANDVSELGSNECDDGLDNDNDGLIDTLDNGCANSSALDESDCGDQVCEGVETWQSCSADCPVPLCSDGLDNDGDDLVDFPTDPGCTDANDNDEYNVPPVTTIEISASVSHSYDDAEERLKGGLMRLTSSDLELVDDQVVGIRFRDINIPKDATIVKAYLQFTVDETEGSNASANLNIHAQAADDAQAFSTSKYDISLRTLTSSSVSWQVPPWLTVNEAGQEQMTPDLSAIIQEVISRDGWSEFNSIVIIISGTGTRTAEAFNGEPGKAPLLVIEYESGPPECSDGVDNDLDELIDFPDDPGCSSATDGDELGQNECDDGIDNDGDGLTDVADQGCIDLTGLDETNCGDGICEAEESWQTCSLDCVVPQCSDGIDNDVDGLVDFPNDPGCLSEADDDEIDELPITTISSIISQSSDDAEEQSSGLMSLTSSDLEMVYDRSNQVVGMRFQNIEIPQAAIITNAYIEFETDEANSVTTNLEFFAQDTDNAQTFSKSSYDISSRVKTSASVQWNNVPVWNSVSEKHRSPDISRVIQQVVDRLGWLSGNSIVIIVTGSGERTAEAYDGESQNAALLVIEYTTEAPVYQCADGIDNDGDGSIDMVDSGCASASDTSEFGDNECDDGIDNDGDGLTDAADQGCIDLTGLDETNCGDGICEAEESWKTCSLDCVVPQCSDGIDNDADGFTDFPGDPGCSSSDDNNEVDFLGNTLRVPMDYSTIPTAIDAAQDGDLVLVSPGTYPGDIFVSKRITIASNFINTENQQDISNTIISGGSDGFSVNTPIGEPMKIIGFTITGAEDAIDFEGGSSIVRNNIFEYNTDDAIDFDGSSESIIENNIIRNNGDDGLEIRLHDYNGPTLNIIIRNNIISGNGEDGIQLIDYPGISDRIFYFYNNIIKGNVYVGLGLMDDGNSTEDYRAASIPEPIYLYNNHFIDNSYGITGGDNLIAINNMVVGTPNIAFKNVDGNSQVSYSLLWNNSVDNSGSNLDTLNNVNEDPLLDLNLKLQSGSPAINAGFSIMEVERDFDGILRPQGAAYDIGAFEYSESISP